MLENPEEIDRLQQLLDHSAAGACPHPRAIITGERRLPRQGPEYETWLDQLDGVGARIAAEKMFTFGTEN